MYSSSHWFPFRRYNISLVILFLLIFFWGGKELRAQYWATKQYGPNTDETLAVAGDANGNTYITGYFSSTANLNGESKTVVGLTDVFVSKILPNGSTGWVVTAGGSSSDRGLSIAVDANANVIVAGFYTKSIDFGNGITLQAENNSQNAFVAKYNEQGQILWAKSGGGSENSDRANGVAVDHLGNVFITGQFSGSANFGPYTLESQNGSIDVFIVKYDASGNELWAKKGSGAQADRGLAITTDNQGSVYVTGQFSNDITFDNTHSNNILNAVFIVKLSESGNEEWFRFAGGSEQSIAHGIASNGSDIYITGDFGNSISFLGAGNSTLNSPFSKSVFLAAYSSTGNLLWKTSQGSTSAVSARAISCRNNQLAVVGWHQCTFESLSQIYGEATFNSLGFKDVYVMRYNTAGEFIYARNFGSIRDEVATGVHIQTDGKEVITGVFNQAIVIPTGNWDLPGTSPLPTPNQDLNYCNDPYYGNYQILGSGSNHAEDGFTIKAIDPSRSPMDIYSRFGSGCDLSIPQACISNSPLIESTLCDENEFSFCPGKAIYAHNFIPLNAHLGYQSNYAWNPGGSSVSNSLTVNASNTYSVTITSKDGCYSQTASADVIVHPIPATPFLSDGAGVNTHTQNPQNIDLCPGESVNIWADFPDDYSFTWTGPGIESSGQTNSDTITASLDGWYTLTVKNAGGCTKSVNVKVIVHEEASEIAPYVVFNPAFEDTLTICSGQNIQGFVKDSITGDVVTTEYTISWNFNPAVSLSGNNPKNIIFQQSGWHYYNIIIKSKLNPCTEEQMQHVITDSLYVLLNPVPVIDFDISPSTPVACLNDTVILYYSASGGTPVFNFEPIAFSEDSLIVIGPGTYSGFMSVTNEFGCNSMTNSTATVSIASTPNIFTVPSNGLLCPGDSIALFLNSFGTPQWHGPNGQLGNEQSVYVYQSGLYFAEVAISPHCTLVSNTVQVTEYATPYINGSGGVLCNENDSLEIFIETSGVASVSWLPPLSGTDTIQIVTQPGVYSAMVMSCGIQTQISLEIVLNSSTVNIVQPDPTPVCIGDSIFITTTSSQAQYEWSNGETTEGIYVHNPGSYQVEVIDDNGCALISNTLDVVFEPLPAPVSFNVNPVCEGETQVVDAISSNPITYTNGLYGEIIQNDPVFVIPDFYGDTTLFAFASSEYCIGRTDSLTISAKPYPDDPIVDSNGSVCTGTAINLQVLNAQEGVLYIWKSPIGNTFSGGNVNYGVPNMDYEGWYSCHADLNGCKSDTAEIYIPLIQTREVELPPDTAMCYKPMFKIFPHQEFSSYLWQDGSSNPWFEPLETADLMLLTTDENGCKSMAIMRIEIEDCSIKVPNIFTPNNDGINDVWRVTTSKPLYYRLVVYNRWGRIVFESNQVNHGWDGNHYKNGEPCSEGVYFYILEIDNFEGMPIKQTGNVTLIRS